MNCNMHRTVHYRHQLITTKSQWIKLHNIIPTPVSPELHNHEWQTMYSHSFCSNLDYLSIRTNACMQPILSKEATESNGAHIFTRHV